MDAVRHRSPVRILVLVLVVGAILGGAPATQLAALQFAGTPETENPEPCIEVVNEIGARRWMGEPGADANASSQQLEEIANTYPHQVSGTSFCSDYSGVEIFILAEGAEARAAAEAAAIESRVPVYIRTAEYSLTELRAEQNVFETTIPNTIWSDRTRGCTATGSVLSSTRVAGLPRRTSCSLPMTSTVRHLWRFHCGPSSGQKSHRPSGEVISRHTKVESNSTCRPAGAR